MIKLYPGSSLAYHWLVAAYEQKSEYEQAVNAHKPSRPFYVRTTTLMIGRWHGGHRP